MIWLVFLLAVACAVLAVYIAALLTEVRRITGTLRMLEEQQSGNGEVYAHLQNKSLAGLALEINRVLALGRRRETRIKKADAAFKESITGISHDLRTPLTSVSGYLQMVRDPTLPEEKRREYFAVIERRLAALLELLDQLFEYTRLELNQQPAQPEKLNLSAVVTTQLALYYHEFTAKAIEPQVSGLEVAAPIFADRKWTERIFQNLIRNALQHGATVLQVALTREGRFYIISFVNPADPELDANRLFDRFYTADPARRSGGGLGLSIVKQLVEHLEGAVSAYHEGGLLHIEVRLPCAD